MGKPRTGKSPAQKPAGKKKKRVLTRTKKPKLRAGDELVVPTRVDITDGIGAGVIPHPIARNKNRVYVDAYVQGAPGTIRKFWYKRSGGTSGNLLLVNNAMDNIGNVNREYVIINLPGGNQDNGYEKTQYVR